LVKLQSFKSIAEQTCCELKIKDSRFIGTIAPVWSEGDAHAFLTRIRAEYRDASHNVFAFRVLDSRRLLERQSDDGEPSGTAGRPILDVVEGAELVNVCVNVTRYFGGTLLGTGGLVRAYQAAARAAISLARTAEFRRLLPARLTMPYNVYDKFTHTARSYSHRYIVTDSSFAEDVDLTIVCAEDSAEFLRSFVTSLSQSAQLTFGEAYYGVLS